MDLAVYFVQLIGNFFWVGAKLMGDGGNRHGHNITLADFECQTGIECGTW